MDFNVPEAETAKIILLRPTIKKVWVVIRHNKKLYQKSQSSWMSIPDWPWEHKKQQEMQVVITLIIPSTKTATCHAKEETDLEEISELFIL